MNKMIKYAMSLLMVMTLCLPNMQAQIVKNQENQDVLVMMRILSRMRR